MINCKWCGRPHDECTCVPPSNPKRVSLGHGKHILEQHIESLAAGLRTQVWAELTAMGKLDGLSNDQKMGVAIAYIMKLRDIL